MSFPDTPLKIVTELLIDGSWQDISADVLDRDPVSITRGKPDEGAAVDPGSCSLTLNNGVSKLTGVVGRYSPRNPRSDLYGKFGRNTPLRVSVFQGGVSLDNSAGKPDATSTPDTAALDITGDLDIRWEGETDWYSAGAQMLIGKWGAAGNRSYHMRLENGLVYLHTTQDGTVGRFHNYKLPDNLPKRAALRVTMDVDNGAGGATAHFYWAESMDGPWIDFSGVNNSTGTLTIFSSSAPLTIAPQQLDSGITVLRYPFKGRCYRAEVRNGINGTVVASPNFEAQAAGTTTFTDSASRVWTVGAGAAINNRRTRFVGEVSEWPTRWNVDGSDGYVPLVASGILRRLSQGKKALDSSLRRRIPMYKPLSYWPMEEGQDATQAVNLGLGTVALKISPVDWASADSLASTSPLPTLRSQPGVPTQMYGAIPPAPTSQSSWHIQWVYRNDNVNATVRTYMRVISTGTVAEWYLQWGSGVARVIGKNAEGGTVFTTDTGIGADLWGRWVRAQLTVNQSDANTVSWQLIWQDVGGDAGAGVGTFTGTAGRPVAVASPPEGFSSDLDGMALGHISAWAPWDSRSNDAYTGAITGWVGETAGERMIRLASEELLPLAVADGASDHAQVGPQYPDTLINTIEDASAVDGGILYEHRDNIGLAYRGRASFYNQPVGLALDFNARGLVTPVEPVDDDQLIRNDRTIERVNGGAAQAVLESGPLSVQEPPLGVGTYNDSTTLNLYSDDQAAQTAWWYLRRGTVDEARYPSIMVDLARAPELILDVVAMEVGDRLTITNPPEWLPPGTIDQRVEGYQETLSLSQWFIEYNCTPHSVWNVAVADDIVLGHADTDGSELAAPLGATDTTVSIRTTDGPVWTSVLFDSPYDLKVGGEVVRVTAPGTLLNANPFFNTDISGWTTQSSTLVRSTDFVHPNPAAVASMKVTPTATGNANAIAPSPGVPVVPGTAYVSGAWVYAPNGFGDVRIRVNWHDSAGTYLSTSASTAFSVPAGQWKYIEQQNTAPAGAAFGRVLVGAIGTPAVSDVIYYWAVRLTANAAPTTVQSFTVVRSVNGVSKSHSAGEPISLANPAIVAL